MQRVLRVAMCASAAVSVGCWSGASGGFQPHVGASFASDPAPDGPEGTGGAVAIRGAGMKRLDDTFSLGGQLGFSFQVATAAGPDDTVRYFMLDPAIQARAEYGRFIAHAWLGAAIGFRSVDGQRTGQLVDNDHSAGFVGTIIGAAALVQLYKSKSGESFELGPYADFARLSMFEDEDRTDFDEEGMTALLPSIGVVMQFWAE